MRDGSGIAHASQRALAPSDAKPLRLLEAPRGATSNPQNYPNRPYAGAFETLRVQGATARGGIEIRTTHTFKAAYIETEWRVSGAKGKQIEVLFPSWGKAKVTAVMSSGARKPVTNGMALSNVDHFHVESEHSGYVVMLRKGAAGAKALTRRPSAQSSAPNPGPTLTLQVKATTVTARIAPAKTAEEARALAAGCGEAAALAAGRCSAWKAAGAVREPGAPKRQGVGVATTVGTAVGVSTGAGVGVAVTTGSGVGAGAVGVGCGGSGVAVAAGFSGVGTGVAMPLAGGGVYFCSRARFSIAARASIRLGLPGRVLRNLRMSSNIALRSAWLGLVLKNLRMALLSARYSLRRVLAVRARRGLVFAGRLNVFARGVVCTTATRATAGAGTTAGAGVTGIGAVAARLSRLGRRAGSSAYRYRDRGRDLRQVA